MSDSIRDQLLKLGLKPKPAEPRPTNSRRPEPPRKPDGGRGGPHQAARPGQSKPASPNQGQHRPGKPVSPGPTRPRSQEEIDLAKAYALRAQAERQEAERLKREAEEKARQKRERKEKLQALLDGKGLARPEAEIARHFEHRGKIRRVYVDDAQFRAINAGALGVVQLEGRYLIVERELALQVRELAPDMIAVLLEPGEAVDDEFQVLPTSEPGPG